jgi:hypothetical protein
MNLPAAVQFGVESIFGDVVSDSIGSLKAAIATAQNAAKNLTGLLGGMTSNFVPAITALQGAGNAAVGVIGPGLAALTSAQNVADAAKAVWVLNGKLAAVNNSSSAGLGDLQNAIAIASSMAAQYDAAISLAKSQAAAAPPVGAAPAAPKAAPAPARAPAPVYVAPTAAPAAAPSTALVAAAPPPSLAVPIALGTGGVFGLLLGGAVGWRAGAHVGLYVGGPLGAAFGAGVGWALTRALNLSPQPTSA